MNRLWLCRRMPPQPKQEKGWQIRINGRVSEQMSPHSGASVRAAAKSLIRHGLILTVPLINVPVRAGSFPVSIRWDCCYYMPENLSFSHPLKHRTGSANGWRPGKNISKNNISGLRKKQSDPTPRQKPGANFNAVNVSARD